MINKYWTNISSKNISFSWMSKINFENIWYNSNILLIIRIKKSDKLVFCEDRDNKINRNLIKKKMFINDHNVFLIVTIKKPCSILNNFVQLIWIS